MNTFVTISKITDMLETTHTAPQTDRRVRGLISAILGHRVGRCIVKGEEGSYYLTGKSFTLDSADQLVLDAVSSVEKRAVLSSDVLRFGRAKTETGIFVRAGDFADSTHQNESIVMAFDDTVINITHVIVVADRSTSKATGTYVCGYRLEEVAECDPPFTRIGTKTLPVPHISCLKRSNQFLVLQTAAIARQMVIFGNDVLTNTILASAPACRFRST